MSIRSSICSLSVPLLALLAMSPAHAQLAYIGPAFIDFGPVKMGATVSAPVTVLNQNPFPLNLAGGGFTISNGFSSMGGTCGAVLAANSSCTITYTFRPRSPTATVENSTTIVVGSGDQHQQVLLSFRGTGNEPLVQVTPRFIDFGEEMIGETLSKSVTITNTHNEAVNIAGGGIDGAFDAVTGTPSCVPGVAPGASCRIDYFFTPGQTAEVNGATTIQASASGIIDSYSIELRGRGRSTAGAVLITPVEIDFGAIKLGEEVEHRVFATNRTSGALNRAGGGFGVVEGFGASVGGEPGCEAGAFPAGATCSGLYFFRPRLPQSHAVGTVLDIWSDDIVIIQSLSLSGTGVGTLARLSPVEIDFGNVRVGAQGALILAPVTLLNTSRHTLTNILGGNVTGPFSRTSTCGSTLAVGASCVLTYQFIPQIEGEYMATTILSYTNSTGTLETVEIVLSGVGATNIFANGFE